jgi:hypothetical protein
MTTQPLFLAFIRSPEAAADIASGCTAEIFCTPVQIVVPCVLHNSVDATCMIGIGSPSSSKLAGALECVCSPAALCSKQAENSALYSTWHKKTRGGCLQR